MKIIARQTPRATPDMLATAKTDKRPGANGLTLRALLLGIVLTGIVDFWIHWAELIMGGKQGHSALVNTAVPVGPFSVLFIVTALNLLLRALRPSLGLSPGECLVIYIMMTTSCVLSSSGQLHFIIPTVTAAWHYATPENGWASLFQRYVPHWLAQTDPTVLTGFYRGHTAVPVLRWLPQMSAWIGFMLALAAATLCIVVLLSKQWIERERLSFPTVALPLAVLDPEAKLLKSRIFWLGAALPFAVSCLNTLALNIPAIPQLNLRAGLGGTADLGQMLTTPPWSAVGYTPLSFYPFVIGIAYLVPVDVSFSCWFFFLLTRVERIIGSEIGANNGVTGAQQATFPYLGHQGAGAFLALAVVSLWLSRSYLAEIGRSVFQKAVTAEGRSYRLALGGLLLSLCVLIGFCVAAGMHLLVAIALIGLGLAYMIAATRIRAETGNAWLFGPDVDVNMLMTRTFGTDLLSVQDLTILAFLRPAIANFDFRCLAMPHQMEALKMGQEVGVRRRALLTAIAVATTVGLTISFLIALTIWHRYGAEAGTEPWRTSQGRVPFDNLADLLRNHVGPDVHGIGALIFGFALMAVLMLLRAQFVWWPLHPVGYAVANTATMTATWLPFLVAWLLKVFVLRYGGGKFYRMTLPFFLGLIAGDLLGGGLFTALGAFTGINVYPINW